MWQEKRRLWLEVCVWLAIGISAYAITFQFDDPIQGYRWGATAWPRAIIMGLLAIAILQFVVAMRKTAVTKRPNAGEAAQAQRQTPEDKPVLKVALSFVLPLFYLLLLPRTGFYLTTPVFLLAYLFLLGERRWTRLIQVTAIIYAIMIIVFTTIFYVPLPVGYWPLFYDTNNWLLQVYR
ncbi:MAG: tripartite tricarboxylate transporter TctB family protein [Proteobacteria bacterium]|nr:tripartite tricarboxylate transporter TctB family protein [Pseudomonadota bacterium]